MSLSMPTPHDLRPSTPAPDGPVGPHGLEGLLADLDGLTERLERSDVSEHVVVLEDAHRRLRQALDAPAS